jgi:hypothetical protein
MKEYSKPTLDVVSYDEKDNIMVVSSVKQTRYNEKSYSAIEF